MSLWTGFSRAIYVLFEKNFVWFVTSFSNVSTPRRRTTKLLLGPLTIARGQKACFSTYKEFYASWWYLEMKELNSQVKIALNAYKIAVLKEEAVKKYYEVCKERHVLHLWSASSLQAFYELFRWTFFHQIS